MVQIDSNIVNLIQYMWQERVSEDYQNFSVTDQHALYDQEFVKKLKSAAIVQADHSLDITRLEDDATAWQVYRGLVNLRKPLPVDSQYLIKEDKVLEEKQVGQSEIDDADLSELHPNIYLWQGDITTLKVDAIVNAANKDGLGCFVPNHNCIDNVIHTKAGVNLRLAMNEQLAGRKLPVGKVVVTDAYHLPSQYVFHTVGPMIFKLPVSKMNQDLLATCYRKCLIKAIDMQLASIAFCSISTGEFHFPRDLARDIAVKTVMQVLAETKAQIKVVFNVFSDEDAILYQEVLMNESSANEK